MGIFGTIAKTLTTIARAPLGGETMGRYEKEHRYVDVGIPFLPMMVNETVITDTKTGKQGKGLDLDSFEGSDRKAWEDLKKDT